MTTAIAPINLVVPDDPPSSQSPSGRSLLVLDHDRFVREACREAAISLGYRASATDSVEQALWLVDSQRVDVVLLDLNLPGGVGLDVLQQLKRLRPESEVIAMTSNGMVQSAVDAMKAGAFDCLPKPFGLQELRLLLQRVDVQL
jgi:DNA-binding NtrC family response regulator